jgi:integrase
MSRIAKPRKFRGNYVTEAGGKLTVLCPIIEGMPKARKELTQHLARVEQEKGQASSPIPPRHTVADCAEEFLSLKRSSKSKRTIEYYEGYLVRLKKWFGHMDVGDITFSHGNEFLKRLKELKLGPVSINHHTKCARAAFGYALECRWIGFNPWRRLPKLPEMGRRRIVTVEEFAKLISACDGCRAHATITSEENSMLLKDILRVLRWTALRPGEIRKLRFDHLHLDENLIVISADEHKTGHTTSSPAPRIVSYLDDAKLVFETRLQKFGNLPRVFPNLNGEEWDDKVFSRRSESLSLRLRSASIVPCNCRRKSSLSFARSTTVPIAAPPRCGQWLTFGQLCSSSG